MNEEQHVKKKNFLPSGMEWVLVITLLALIIASLGYLSMSIEENREALKAQMASSGGMRSMPPTFNFEPTSIAKDKILSGGPAKDGIPALTNPKMITADAADYLNEEDRVVGVEFEGQAMAYPLKILDYHEVVNETVGDIHFAITYCPLCDSVTVFDRKMSDGEIKEFGVSGLLYNSNVLFYDRQSNDDEESLWSQMRTEAVTGVSNQEELETLPYQLTSWVDWKTRNPETKVLSEDTGYSRNYSGTTYQDYFQNDSLWFPVDHEDDRLPIKERVVGVKIGEQAKAYPIGVIETEGGSITDTIAGHEIEIKLEPNGTDAYVVDFPENAKVINSFWFAWAAFHPETEVYQ